MGTSQTGTVHWAVSFEKKVRDFIMSGNYKPLINYESIGTDSRLAVPTPEHYLPLLYILGAKDAQDPISFQVEGVDGGSLSMLAVQVG